MKWFQEHSTAPEYEMSEPQFMQFLQSLTKIYDWEVYEILDILDRRHTGTVSWEAFYILLSLYTAYYSKKLTKFLYKHGATVFQFVIDPVTKRLTFERFSRLGFLVGLSEDDILETCLFFGVRKNAMEMIGQEDFLLFYFSIFNTIDTGIDLLKDNQTHAYNPPPNKLTRVPSGGNLKATYQAAASSSPSGTTATANGKCVIQ